MKYTPEILIKLSLLPQSSTNFLLKPSLNGIQQLQSGEFSRSGTRAREVALNRYGLPESFFTSGVSVPTGEPFEKIRKAATDAAGTAKDWSLYPPSLEELSRISGMPIRKEKGKPETLELPDVSMAPTQVNAFEESVKKEKEDAEAAKKAAAAKALQVRREAELQRLAEMRSAAAASAPKEVPVSREKPVKITSPLPSREDAAASSGFATAAPSISRKAPSLPSWDTSSVASDVGSEFGGDPYSSEPFYPTGGPDRRVRFGEGPRVKSSLNSSDIARRAYERAAQELPPLPSGGIGIPESKIRQAKVLKAKAEELGLGDWYFAKENENVPISDPEIFETVNQIKDFSKSLGLNPQALAYAPARDVVLTAQPDSTFKEFGGKVLGPYALEDREAFKEEAPEEPKSRIRTPMPKFTEIPKGTTEGLFVNQPPFISESARDIVENVAHLAREDPKKYPGKRVASINPLQELAANKIRAHVAKDPFASSYNEATGLTRKTSQEDVAKEIQPMIEEALKPAHLNIANYLSPHQEHVIEAMYKHAGDNFDRSVLRPLQNRLYAKGMGGSSIRPKLMLEAMENFNRDLQDQEAKLRDSAFKEALSKAEADRNKHFSAAQLLSQTKGRDILSRLEASKQLHQQTQAREQQKLSHADLLRMLGTEQYNIKQQELNKTYEDFEEERLHPYKQLAFKHEMTRGLPVNIATLKTSTAVAPQPVIPSGLTTAGGLLQGIGGMLASGQKMAEGGQVKKGYEPNPDEEQYLQGMQASSDRLRGMGGNPMWDFISRMGFESAASKDPHWSSRVGQSALNALDSYDRSRASQEQREMASMKIRNKMLETKMVLGRQAMEDQKAQESEAFKSQMMEKALEQKAAQYKSKMEHQAMEDQMKRERHNLEMKMDPEKHSAEMQLKNAQMQQILNKLKPREENSAYANAPNEAALTAAYKSDLKLSEELPGRISTLNEIQNALDNLEKLRPLGPRSLPSILQFGENATTLNKIEKEAQILSNNIMSKLGAKAAGPTMAKLISRGIPNVNMTPEAYNHVIGEYRKGLELSKRHLQRDIERLKNHGFEIEGLGLPETQEENVSLNSEEKSPKGGFNLDSSSKEGLLAKIEAEKARRAQSLPRWRKHGA